jgi:hypothetical protein
MLAAPKNTFKDSITTRFRKSTYPACARLPNRRTRPIGSSRASRPDMPPRAPKAWARWTRQAQPRPRHQGAAGGDRRLDVRVARQIVRTVAEAVARSCGGTTQGRTGARSAGAQSALGRKPAIEQVIRLFISPTASPRGFGRKPRPGRTVTVRVRFADLKSLTRSTTLEDVARSRLLAAGLRHLPLACHEFSKDCTLDR